MTLFRLVAASLATALAVAPASAAGPSRPPPVTIAETAAYDAGTVPPYTGEGVKSILPHRALAKLDSRLVPDQTPDAALALIRRHLDANGFDDIEIRKLSGYPPAQTSVDAPLVHAAISVYRKHGHTPAVAPRLAGSAPYHVFTERLGLPMIAGGLGHGSGAHAPNEYMVVAPAAGSRVAGLEEIEGFYVDLLYALADALKAEASR